MSGQVLTAGAPAPRILKALRDAGWGMLAGDSCRAWRFTLWTLCELVNPHTGTVDATARQIALRTGYSVVWTRVALHALEQLGLITWRRGGVVDGQTTPSVFRVSKAAVLAMVDPARAALLEADLEHARATRARLERYKLENVRSKTYKRRSVPRKVTLTLPPLSGGKPTTAPENGRAVVHNGALAAKEVDTEARAGYLAAMRAALPGRKR